MNTHTHRCSPGGKLKHNYSSQVLTYSMLLLPPPLPHHLLLLCCPPPSAPPEASPPPSCSSSPSPPPASLVEASSAALFLLLLLLSVTSCCVSSPKTSIVAPAALLLLLLLPPLPSKSHPLSSAFASLQNIASCLLRRTSSPSMSPCCSPPKAALHLLTFLPLLLLSEHSNCAPAALYTAPSASPVTSLKTISSCFCLLHLLTGCDLLLPPPRRCSSSQASLLFLTFLPKHLLLLHQVLLLLLLLLPNHHPLLLSEHHLLHLLLHLLTEYNPPTSLHAPPNIIIPCSSKALLLHLVLLPEPESFCYCCSSFHKHHLPLLLAKLFFSSLFLRLACPSSPSSTVTSFFFCSFSKHYCFSRCSSPSISPLTSPRVAPLSILRRYLLLLLAEHS